MQQRGEPPSGSPSQTSPAQTITSKVGSGRHGGQRPALEMQVGEREEAHGASEAEQGQHHRPPVEVVDLRLPGGLGGALGGIGQSREAGGRSPWRCSISAARRLLHRVEGGDVEPVGVAAGEPFGELQARANPAGRPGPSAPRPRRPPRSCRDRGGRGRGRPSPRSRTPPARSAPAVCRPAAARAPSTRATSPVARGLRGEAAAARADGGEQAPGAWLTIRNSERGGGSSITFRSACAGEVQFVGAVDDADR